MKIVSHTTSSDKEWSAICIESQREFAEKHSIPYTLYENLDIDGRSPEWSRFRVMQGEITASAGRPIIWMDSDLLIMNPEFDLVGMANEFETSRSVSGCFFTLEGTMDLGLAFIKNVGPAPELFDYGWEVGGIEAHGNRRDKLSIELMNFLAPDLFRLLIPDKVVSHWYPDSPEKMFDHHIDSAEGKVGLFTMKKPKEMVEGFNDLFVPGTFSVHLKKKGPSLLEDSKKFLEYRERMMKSVIESRELMKDLA